MADSAKKTILLVDDSPLFLTQMKDLLGEASFMTIECSDSRKARDVIEGRFGDLDLVITDLNMPNWDGFELIGWLRDQPYGGSLPVVVMTGAYEMSEIVGRLSELKVNGLLNKGAHPQHIVTRVNAILFPEMEDKRRHERVSVHIPSSFYTLDGAAHDAVITNISLGGCFLVAEDLTPANEMVSVRIALPDHERIIHQPGEVVWVVGKESWQGKKRAIRGMGVQWAELTDSNRLFLEGYIEDAQKTERLFTTFSP